MMKWKEREAKDGRRQKKNRVKERRWGGKWEGQKREKRGDERRGTEEERKGREVKELAGLRYRKKLLTSTTQHLLTCEQIAGVLGGDSHTDVLTKVGVIVIQLIADDAVTPQLTRWLHPRQLDRVG